MKFTYLLIMSMLLFVTSCDKKNDDLVEPPSASDFPQVIKFDDEGDGDLEDEDKFSFKLTLNDRVDPSGDELGGTVVPLKEDVTVLFEVKGWEGFNSLSEYIKGVKAFYEIDDCTTSEDAGIDLDVSFDAATGKGSVRFPKDVTEVEVEFETDEDLFDDNDLNEDERSITLIVTGIQPVGKTIAYNKAAEFKYEILDDEGIHGDWELDHEDAAQFAAFKKLFGMVNEDIADLSAGDVDKIEISVEYNEVKVVVELKEKETVEECGGTEEVNKVIEIEADLEDISTLTSEGDIEFVGEVELDNGGIAEFVYKGSFKIIGGDLELVLVGEYDDEETDEITLQLKK